MMGWTFNLNRRNNFYGDISWKAASWKTKIDNVKMDLVEILQVVLVWIGLNWNRIGYIEQVLLLAVLNLEHLVQDTVSVAYPIVTLFYFCNREKACSRCTSSSTSTRAKRSTRKMWILWEGWPSLQIQEVKALLFRVMC